MGTMARYPSLFQINTRVWLQCLSREAGKRVTLADIDDATLDGFAEQGFDWIWLLSIWQIGSAGRAVLCSNPQWHAEFQTVLPDLTEEDIGGSGLRDHGVRRRRGAGWRRGARRADRDCQQVRRRTLRHGDAAQRVRAASNVE